MIESSERTLIILAEVRAEMIRAEVFGPFSSYHEAIAVIREEYLELEREIFHGEKGYTSEGYRAAKRRKAIHFAAMAVKLIQKIDADANRPEDEG